MRAFDSAPYIGIPYRAGGRSPSGIDCWGLVRHVYGTEYGIDLPGHDEANTEAADGPALADYLAAHREGWERVGQPDIGDLVLLHVGPQPHIGVVTGPGRFLHARSGHDSAEDRYTAVQWARRIDGFYRYAPKGTAVTVSGCPHPLRMTRIDGQSPAGETLRAIILTHCERHGVPAEQVRHGLAFVNGVRIPVESWPDLVLAEGDRVDFRILPAGGDDGLRGILMIAVMVVAAWASGGASAAWTPELAATYGMSASTVGALAGMAATVAGMALVNHVAPIRPPQLAEGLGAPKPQYLLAGGPNQAQPYTPFPVVLGAHDFTAPLGAKSWLETNGSDRFLHLLIVWGYGPLDVRNLRIGDTPLTDFEDVDVLTTEGEAWEYDAQGNLIGYGLQNLYGNVVEQQQPQVELGTGWTTRTTSQANCLYFDIMLSFPAGLVHYNDNGSAGLAGVEVQVESRRLGYYDAGGTWVPVTEAWKGNWSGLSGLPATEVHRAGQDSKAIVGLRNGNWLFVKTSVAYWTEIGDGGGFYNPATWPAMAANEIEIYRIENGALVGAYNTDRYTGLTPTFATANGVTTVAIGAGTALGQDVFQGADNDPFDRQIAVNVMAAPGQYEIRVRRTTEPSADARISDKVWWLALTEFDWTERPIRPPKPMAMTALRIRATNQINGTLDGVTATLATRQLVWKSGAWQAPGANDRRNNPASLFRYVLQHPANARPVADSAIDLAQLAHWSEFCDAKGFIYENVLTGQRPMREVLADIAAAGRASITMPDGKWSVAIDEPKAAIAQHFTPHNSWGFQGQRLLPRVPHALRINFLNRDKDYQPDELLVYADGYSASNATLVETIELPGVTSAGSAAAPGPVFKLARFHLEQLILRPEEYTLNTDIENLVCTRGDRVKVMHDVPMWGLGSGRIKGRTVNGSGYATAVTLDEPVQMETGKTYTLRWRTAGNASNTATVTGTDGLFEALTFTAPVTANLPDAGDLFMFGELNAEAVDCLVKNIEPLADRQARITLVDYAPALFDAESAPFGTWSSQITLPPPLARSYIDQLPFVEQILADERALTRSGGTLQANLVVRFSTTLAI